MTKRLIARILTATGTLAALAYLVGAPHKYLLSAIPPSDRGRGLRRNGHHY